MILAGGEATRLPGKLALAAGELPLLARVYRNVAGAGEMLISGKGPLPPDVAALVPCPVVVDRWPARGPLGGLLSTLGEMQSAYIFAVAGDAPFIDSGFITRLAEHIRPGDEAVIPTHAGRIEPLAAIYERAAFLREGMPVLTAGRGAITAVIDRLAARYVPMHGDERIFANINTPADYAALREVL